MSIPIFDIDKPKVKGNKILAFANHKGGVGKSTLSVMFSDFLAD